MNLVTFLITTQVNKTWLARNQLQRKSQERSISDLAEVQNVDEGQFPGFIVKKYFVRLPMGPPEPGANSFEFDEMRLFHLRLGYILF